LNFLFKLYQILRFSRNNPNLEIYKKISKIYLVFRDFDFFKKFCKFRFFFSILRFSRNFHFLQISGIRKFTTLVQGLLDDEGKEIKTNFPTREAADQARLRMIAAWEAVHGQDNQIYQDMTSSRPKLSQKGYDSRYVMETFHDKAIEYITGMDKIFLAKH